MNQGMCEDKYKGLQHLDPFCAIDNPLHYSDIVFPFPSEDRDEIDWEKFLDILLATVRKQLGSFADCRNDPREISNEQLFSRSTCCGRSDNNQLEDYAHVLTALIKLLMVLYANSCQRPNCTHDLTKTQSVMSLCRSTISQLDPSLTNNCAVVSTEESRKREDNVESSQFINTGIENRQDQMNLNTIPSNKLMSTPPMTSILTSNVKKKPFKNDSQSECVISSNGRSIGKNNRSMHRESSDKRDGSVHSVRGRDIALHTKCDRSKKVKHCSLLTESELFLTLLSTINGIIQLCLADRVLIRIALKFSAEERSIAYRTTFPNAQLLLNLKRETVLITKCRRDSNLERNVNMMKNENHSKHTVLQKPCISTDFNETKKPIISKIENKSSPIRNNEYCRYNVKERKTVARPLKSPSNAIRPKLPSAGVTSQSKGYHKNMYVENSLLNVGQSVTLLVNSTNTKDEMGYTEKKILEEIELENFVELERSILCDNEEGNCVKNRSIDTMGALAGVRLQDSKNCISYSPRKWYCAALATIPEEDESETSVSNDSLQTHVKKAYFDEVDLLSKTEDFVLVDSNVTEAFQFKVNERECRFMEDKQNLDIKDVSYTPLDNRSNKDHEEKSFVLMPSKMCQLLVREKQLLEQTTKDLSTDVKRQKLSIVEGVNNSRTTSEKERCSFNDDGYYQDDMTMSNLDFHISIKSSNIHIDKKVNQKSASHSECSQTCLGDGMLSESPTEETENGMLRRPMQETSPARKHNVEVCSTYIADNKTTIQDKRVFANVVKEPSIFQINASLFDSASYINVHNKTCCLSVTGLNTKEPCDLHRHISNSNFKILNVNCPYEECSKLNVLTCGEKSTKTDNPLLVAPILSQSRPDETTEARQPSYVLRRRTLSNSRSRSTPGVKSACRRDVHPPTKQLNNVDVLSTVTKQSYVGDCDRVVTARHRIPLHNQARTVPQCTATTMPSRSLVSKSSNKRPTAIDTSATSRLIYVTTNTGLIPAEDTMPEGYVLRAKALRRKPDMISVVSGKPLLSSDY